MIEYHMLFATCYMSFSLERPLFKKTQMMKGNWCSLLLCFIRTCLSSVLLCRGKYFTVAGEDWEWHKQVFLLSTQVFLFCSTNLFCGDDATTLMILPGLGLNCSFFNFYNYWGSWSEPYSWGYKIISILISGFPLPVNICMMFGFHSEIIFHLQVDPQATWLLKEG